MNELFSPVAGNAGVTLTLLVGSQRGRFSGKLATPKGTLED